MGTTGIRKSISATKEMIVKDYNFSNPNLISQVLKTSSYGNQFWLLRRIVVEGNEFVTADVILISHESGMTYYKELNISSGPYYYHCPLAWLEKITVVGEHIERWKEDCRKYWKKRGIEIVSGMKLEFQGNAYTVLEKHTSHFWLVKRNDGKVFKMKNLIIKESLLVSEII